MDEQQMIIFSFPRKALLESDLIGRMEIVQGLLKEIPDGRQFSITGNTAAKIVEMIDGTSEEPSNLVLHAMRELELVGNDEDFNRSIIAAVEAFGSYGHSGGSAAVAVPMLNDLLQYKNLTPLTDDSNEWFQVEMGDEECWQSKRNPEAFSNDGGKTYYLLSEGAAANEGPAIMHDSVAK